jgi:two-component system response regulator HydG
LRLLVFSESDSFRDYYRELGEKTGLAVQFGRDLGEGAGNALVIISCPGVEERAADRVRDARGVVARPPVVVGTRTDHRLAVEVVRAGADDYFVLPEEAELLTDYVRSRAEAVRSEGARAELAESEREEFDFSRILGESRGMREALARAARIIPRGTATVLITGETGTGKELLAHAIHYNGPRAKGPFVEVNCSAIPANLLESELFGHERGAFTDARRAKPGLLEMADGGTLFLDEIGEMPLELQGKVLKVIEDKRVRRVGGTRMQKVDVRIIAATNRDLTAELKAGNFREDLYYRLSVIPIHLPPLRERGDDILLLAEHFLDTMSKEYGLPRPALSPSLRDRLLAYPWPGNVRELRNSIERALLLSDGGELRPEDLFGEAIPAPAARSGAGVLPFPATMDEIELAAVRAMLEETGDNKSAAARRLGISRSRLHRAVRRLAEIGGRPRRAEEEGDEL